MDRPAVQRPQRGSDRMRSCYSSSSHVCVFGLCSCAPRWFVSWLSLRDIHARQPVGLPASHFWFGWQNGKRGNMRNPAVIKPYNGMDDNVCLTLRRYRRTCIHRSRAPPGLLQGSRALSLVVADTRITPTDPLPEKRKSEMERGPRASPLDPRLGSRRLGAGLQGRDSHASASLAGDGP